jgi:hypothetical protein
MSLAALDPSNPIFKVTPALSIPNYVPNFDDPKNIALLIKFTVGICFAASTVMILLRIWVRFFIMKAHGWDDCTYYHRTLRVDLSSNSYSRHDDSSLAMLHSIRSVRSNCSGVRLRRPSIRRSPQRLLRLSQSKPYPVLPPIDMKTHRRLVRQRPRGPLQPPNLHYEAINPPPIPTNLLPQRCHKRLDAQNNLGPRPLQSALLHRRHDPADHGVQPP